MDEYDRHKVKYKARHTENLVCDSIYTKFTARQPKSVVTSQSKVSFWSGAQRVGWLARGGGTGASGGLEMLYIFIQLLVAQMYTDAKVLLRIMHVTICKLYQEK